jgi:hypothetical protein
LPRTPLFKAEWLRRHRWLRVGLLVGLLSTSLGCPHRSPLPVPSAGEAPLDRALAALGVNPEDLELPRAQEAGYSVPTAFSGLDAALANPLGLGPLAARLGQELDAAETPLGILSATASFQPGGDTAAGKQAGVEGRASSAVRPLPLPTELIDSASGQLLLGHLPEAFLAEFRSLCRLLEIAAAQLDTCAQSGRLRPPPRAAEEFFLEPWAGESRYRNHPTGIQEEFLAYAQTVDLGCIRGASEALLLGLDSLLPRVLVAANELPESGSIIQLDTALGTVLIGSRGSDTHSKEAALILDPGGDDQWYGAAGANLGVRGPISLAIDLTGNDTYRCERSHCQGSGYGGVGMLMDLGKGADNYFAQSQSQGAGLLGFGLLWDQGGDDAYQADSYGQGAGTLGVGLLLDGGGNDRSVLRARGQGFAATGGLGIYADIAGNDHRRLGLGGESPHGTLAGGGQGGAWGTRSVPWYGANSFHGGVGLLYDRSGNDTYYARAYGQGAAWMLSLGMLLDRAGDDHYVAEWFGQGAAQHLAAGVLVDGGGHDIYEGTNTVQGAALDRSVGLLWDQGSGSDRYRVGTTGSALDRELGPGQAWAAQAHALAFLVDDAGDDTYSAAPFGLGYGLPSSRPDRPAYAFFLDLDGDDTYSLRQARSGGSPAEGAIWLQAGYAVGMDTRSAHPGWAASTPSTLPQDGFTYTPADPSMRSGSDLPTGDLSGDPTSRWAAVESAYRRLLSPSAEPDTSDLVAVLALAHNDPDPAVRRAAARLAFARGEFDGLDILVDSLSFHSEDTRRPSAISSLPFWLSVATGIPEDSTWGEWQTRWSDLQPDFTVGEAWERVQALDAMLLAAGKGDVSTIQDICETVRDLKVTALTPACGQLLGYWAWALGHPESGARRNLALAVELGQQAVLLAPGVAEHFINLARALDGQGHRDLAWRALEKAELLDPDALPLLALQRRLTAETKD